MTFRANEAARTGFENILDGFIKRREINAEERERSKNKLLEIEEKHGPVIECYPSWHPLVNTNSGNNNYNTIQKPSPNCGYEGLDDPKTIYFQNAFITCCYDSDQIEKSVEKLRFNSRSGIAEIKAERLEGVQLLYPDLIPILVYCDWKKPFSSNFIPESLAIPLWLENELSCWRQAKCAETWETMRLYFLGSPHGRRSSLFVDQTTVLTMKKIWDLLVNTKMFGDTIYITSGRNSS